MSWDEFWVILAVCGACMLVCRVLPLFLLKGRSLPEGVTRALALIPPAACAARVATALLSPGMFDAGRRLVAGGRAAGGIGVRGAGGDQDALAHMERGGGRGLLRAAHAAGLSAGQLCARPMAGLRARR